ncbi:hypothetical protein AAMO2058_000191600 [Amorphochlora amoebiformis]
MANSRSAARFACGLLISLPLLIDAETRIRGTTFHSAPLRQNGFQRSRMVGEIGGSRRESGLRKDSRPVRRGVLRRVVAWQGDAKAGEEDGERLDLEEFRKSLHGEGEIEWTDEMDEFIGEKDPDVEQVDMIKVMDILREKSNFEGELERQVSESYGVDIYRNQKGRLSLIQPDPQDQSKFQLTPEFERTLEAIFDAYDIDEDGALSFSEMSAMYARTNKELMPNEFWEEVVSLVEVDKNGITRDGFAEFYTAQAMMDSLECINDLRALGFEDDFPIPEFTEEDSDVLAELLNPGDVKVKEEYADFIDVNLEEEEEGEPYRFDDEEDDKAQQPPGKA